MIQRCASVRNSGRQCWPVLLLAVWCGSAAALGEEKPAGNVTSHPIFSNPTPVSGGSAAAEFRPARMPSPAGVSTQMRSVIQAKLPAYTPVVPSGEPDTPTDAIKLPPVLVNAPKLKLPDKVQSLSREEFAALLRKLYPGASVGGQDPYRIEHGMPNYARLLYENDRRNAQKASFENLADLLEHTGDKAGGQRLKKELQRAAGGTYKDPLMDAMDKSANGGRR